MERVGLSLQHHTVQQELLHRSERGVRQLSLLTKPSGGDRRRVLSVAETSTPYQRQRRLSTSGDGESCRLQAAELS